MIKYLSPSSLDKIETQPYTFYIERILRIAEKSKQGFAAGLGSGFDAYIKNVLLAQLDPELKTKIRGRIEKSCYSEENRQAIKELNLLDAMYYLSVEEHNREAVKMASIGLAMSYSQSKACKATIWEDFEWHKFYDLVHKGRTIPLFMKLDAIIKDPINSRGRGVRGLLSPFDWKVTGYGSLDGVTPIAGYQSLEFLGTGCCAGPHKDYFVNIPMELINYKWATQLCTYGWGIGYPVGTPFYGVIDCLCWKNNCWTIATYLGLISSDFQYRVADRYLKAWTELHDGTFLKSIAVEPDIATVLSRAESWY